MEYLGVIVPLVNGSYAVEFPDFPEAFTEGANMGAARRNALEALQITIEEYAQEGRNLPIASDPEQVMEKALCGELKNEMRPNSLPVLFTAHANPPDKRQVKITVTLTAGELAAIDARAKRLGVSRSALLVRGALG